MGGAFPEGQIIKLDEWLTLPTTPRIEFYGTGFQSCRSFFAKSLLSKSLKSAVTSNLALLDLNKCQSLRQDFKNYQLLRNMHNNKKGLCLGSNSETFIPQIFESSSRR